MRMYIIQLYWEFYQGSQLVFGLGCCVPLPGLVFLLSPVLCPNFSPICLHMSGMLCSPSWLVSQPSLSRPVSHLVLLFGVYGCVILLCIDVLSPLHCLHETQ